MSEARAPARSRERPLITVIVLCHNYGRFLAEAIESALAQTYTPLEVLVMDDGSTDDTLEVAQRYAGRVSVLSHPNMGLERTCNRAVSAARGEYFAFLSADDVFEPAYVEELFRALERSPDASFAYCPARMFGAQEGVMKCFPYSAYLLVRRTNYINGCALTSRSEYLAAGGYSEELRDYGLEDWDFFLKLLARGKRGTYVPQPLLNWRRHPAASRNPETGERAARAIELVRSRHRRLASALAGLRGHAYYLLDLALAATDVVVRYSRWQPALQAIERASWRRYCRWHAPRVSP